MYVLGARRYVVVDHDVVVLHSELELLGGAPQAFLQGTSGLGAAPFSVLSFGIL